MAKKNYAMRALAFLLALLLMGSTFNLTADAARDDWGGGWGGGWGGSGTVSQVSLYWCYSHRATGGSYTRNLDQATVTYNGSSWGFGSGVSLSADGSASITVSPKPGYRVARIDMLCTNTDNRLNPYNCLTYNEGASYRASAVAGSTSIQLNNFTIETACNHTSRSTKYYMMVTLEEVEQEQTYTVTYTPGEGIGADYLDNNAGAGYAFADSYTVASVTDEQIGFTNPGYTFAGWKVTSCTDTNSLYNLVGNTYQGGDTFSMPAGNVVLTAQWEKILVPTYDYTVIYHANYEGSDETAADSENVLGVTDITKTIGVDGNPFSRPGYTFLGWATEPEGKVVYQAGMGITFTQGGKQDLYAKWQEIPKYGYELTYHSNFAPDEAVSDAENIDGVYDTAYAMTADAGRFVRENYTFTGWNTSPDGSGVAYAPGDVVNFTAENNTEDLYAQWQENPKYAYALTYHANFAPDRAVSDAENISGVYDTSRNMGVDENSFVREHYTFIGWNTAPDGSGVAYAPGAVLPLTAENNTEDLYAQWAEDAKYDYAVIYHPGFGEDTAKADAENVQQVYDTEKTITVDANPFTRPNYTFLGWATELDGAVVYLPGDPIAFTLGGEKHLYAKWAENDKYAYTLVYNGNGGALADGALAYGDAENVADVYDTAKTFGIDGNTFIRENFDFLGWNTAADGSGTAYAPGAELTLTAQNNTATLYAQWQEKPKYDYTVTYYANFGEVAPVADAENALQVYDTAKTMGVDANPFVREHYTFIGWNTAPDGSGTAYAPEEILSFQLGGNLELYAQWQIKTYSYTVEYYLRIDGGRYKLYTGQLPEGTVTGGEAAFGAVIDETVVAPASRLRLNGIRYKFVTLEGAVIGEGDNVVRVYYQYNTPKDEEEKPTDPTPPTPPVTPDEPEVIDIPDDDVPLADVPKTGDPMVLYGALCLACTGGFLWLKKKED